MSGTSAAVVENLVALAAWVTVLAVPVVVWRRARRRRARLAWQWPWALDQCACRDVDIAFVQRVYQYARHGSKAIIVWQANGASQDTWFQGWHAPEGVYVVVHGGTGWGPHNCNPNVFYVAPHGVIGWIPGAAPRAWAIQGARTHGPRRSKIPAGSPRRIPPPPGTTSSSSWSPC
jgi:hypothetical protein